MHRCYLPSADWSSPTLLVEGGEAHHAKRVVRLKQGDKCEVFDGRGQAALAVVQDTQGGALALRIEELLPPLPPMVEMTLALAIPKGTNMDLIVQKAVELGVSRIVPVITERTIVRLPGKEAEAKAAKWRRTALEACKQCGVSTVPQVEPVQSFSQLMQRTDLPDLRLVCAIVPHAKPLRSVLEQARRDGLHRIVLLIGPEGDFSPGEYAAAEQGGYLPVSLGSIILRVETAVFMALSSARYALD